MADEVLATFDCDVDDEFALDDLISAVVKRFGTRRYWLVNVENATWRGGGCSLYVRFKNAWNDVQDMISHIAGIYGQCTFYLHKGLGRHFTLRVTHHDCPVSGTYFEFSPLPKKHYEEAQAFPVASKHPPLE